MNFKIEDYQCKTERIWENVHICDTTEEIPGEMY